MAQPPLIVIAAGGTGGHMFPAQALAEVMLARGWRVVLSTDARGLRYSGGFPEAVGKQVVRSATPARGGAAARLLVGPRILAGIWRSLRLFWRDRPAVVVGFGGYPAIPAMAAAWLMRLPRLVHEQNGVPGRVNRVFARRVQVVACSVWPTQMPRGTRMVHTGNPVRAAVRDLAAAPYQPPGDRAMRLLVIGGSQGAAVLSGVVPQAVASLPPALQQRLSLHHQARDADVDALRDAYAQAGISATVAPFFQDVAALLRDAQLIIARAGASSVAEICAIGRPSILVPFAAATNDHQSANAAPLRRAGAAVVLREAQLTAPVLAGHIGAILSDADKAEAMAEAALALGRPDAANALADLVEDISAKDARP